MEYRQMRWVMEGGGARLDEEQLGRRIEQLVTSQRRRYRLLWGYYRNPMRVGAVSESENGSERPYRQAQEWGMPSRITGVRRGIEVDAPPALSEVARKEVVVENDIAWRIDAGVDYLFGKPVVVQSAAPDPQRRELIGKLLRLILSRNGGIVLLQQLALLGAVYGFVDVLVKLLPDDQATAASAPMAEPLKLLGGAPGTSVAAHNGDGDAKVQDLGQAPPGGAQKPASPPDAAARDEAEAASGGTGDGDGSGAGGRGGSASDGDGGGRAAGASGDDSRGAVLDRLSRLVRLEIVEPARALPILSESDYRIVEAYGQVYELDDSCIAPSSPRRSVVARWWRRMRGAAERLWDAEQRPVGSANRALDLVGPQRWQRYVNGALVGEGPNSLGQIPLVHIQNVAVPFEYSGLSDVEPLIPLQDELNTRLSDRANRIALQSFKMYLGKAVENWSDQPVGPGRMWTSSDPEADIVEFGGDANCPSEEAHIADIREAMDKTSAVTPIAAGAIKDRIGRLSSAAALRITLLALLSKTEKKRTTYGAGIARMCELALAWLDRAGLFATTEQERQIELHWPSPLPENDLEKLSEAEAKLRIGVPADVVLREVGY